MKISEVELEERARRLEGKTLRAAAYQGGWRRLGDAHSVTHAVYLELDGTRIEMAPKDELGIVHGFGISIRERKVLDPAFGAITEVSHELEWKRLIGGEITRAMVHWEDVFERLRGSLSVGIAIHADYLRRRDFPVTIEMVFAAGSVFVSAARLAQDGVAHPLAPELVVFFSAQTGEALGLR